VPRLALTLSCILNTRRLCPSSAWFNSSICALAGETTSLWYCLARHRHTGLIAPLPSLILDIRRFLVPTSRVTSATHIVYYYVFMPPRHDASVDQRPFYDNPCPLLTHPSRNFSPLAFMVLCTLHVYTSAFRLPAQEDGFAVSQRNMDFFCTKGQIYGLDFASLAKRNAVRYDPSRSPFRTGRC